MSQENVEIVRRSGEDFLRAAIGDGVFENFDSRIEWAEMPSLGPDASVYRGIKTVREAIESWTRMWDEYSFEVQRIVDIDDLVVVLATESGHGRSSGVTTERELGEVFSVREGRIIRVRLYGSWHDALEAAGLSE